MKRIILTTCGTSLFNSSCWGYKQLNAKHISKLEDKLKLTHELKCNSELKYACKYKINIHDTFDTSSWEKSIYQRDLPAEIASLRAIQQYFQNNFQNGGGKRPLSNEDQVIILHSDSDEGLFCGNTIYNVLEVLKGKNLFPNVKLEHWPIPGLDPEDKYKFGEALEKIWNDSISKFKEDCGVEYIFNLTGGYKAVSILLGAFAYTNCFANIFYLYEKTNYDHILVASFDPNSCIKAGINSFKAKYIDVSTGREIGHIDDESFD